MPEPLKQLYNRQLIDALCTELKKEFKPFDSKAFSSTVFDSDWKNKELKQRIRHITISLNRFLPENYKQTLSILKPVATRLSGFEYIVFPDYVECYGIDDYSSSISALEIFTEYSTSELAVRPFIIKYEEKMMAQMARWSRSHNPHIRRLSSEGCRPRLPWAMALPRFKKDPSAVMKIISNLLGDESEYVRRSVANNLNDISKDHPEIIIELTEQHLGRSIETDKLLKHACRTLLKGGNCRALRLYGFSQPDHICINDLKIQESLQTGEFLKFSFSLLSDKKVLGKIRIEYAIDFMKSNGRQARKVFKISESNVDKNTKLIEKNHSFKIITTRRYYSGTHGLAILINGQQLASGEFELLVKK